MSPSNGELTSAERIPHRTAPFLVWLSRAILGAVLLWSSIMKLRQPYDFLTHVYQYEILSAANGRFISMILPWIELTAGIALLSGVFLGGALIVSVLLMLIFSMAQLSVLYRGLRISCGCFGSFSPDQVNYTSLARSILLTLLAIGGCVAFLRGAAAATGKAQ